MTSASTSSSTSSNTGYDKDGIIDDLYMNFSFRDVIPFYSSNSHPSNEEFKVYLFKTADKEKASGHGFLELYDQVITDVEFFQDFMDASKDLQHFGLGRTEIIKFDDGEILENYTIVDPLENYEKREVGTNCFMYIPRYGIKKEETKKKDIVAPQYHNYYDVLADI